MEIRLKTLHLENFKCHKSLTIDFGGKNTSIYGDNATGKTSIYDAFVWLLFGKDSAGNGEKNIEVKPLAADGSVLDHQAVTEVEAVLLADGEETVLKRIIPETITVTTAFAEGEYGWWGDVLYRSKVGSNVYTPAQYADNWEAAQA